MLNLNSDKDAVDKWEETGLLDDLEKDEEPLANALEQCYEKIKKLADRDVEDENLEFSASIVFPAISRAYRQSDASSIDGEKFFYEFRDRAEKYRELVRDLESMHDIDGEAEITQLFVDYYVNKYLS